MPGEPSARTADPGADIEHPILGRDAGQLGPRQRPRARERAIIAVQFVGLVHRNHVGVLDRGGEPRLPLKSSSVLSLASEVRGDRLESDGPIQPQLRGAVDDAHPAATRHGLDAVAGDGFPKGGR